MELLFSTDTLQLQHLQFELLLQSFRFAGARLDGPVVIDGTTTDRDIISEQTGEAKTNAPTQRATGGPATIPRTTGQQL